MVLVAVSCSPFSQIVSPHTGAVPRVKVAVVVLGVLIVIVQGFCVPVHAPLHPAKVFPAVGLAVRVTSESLLKGAVQVVPQLIPVGFEVMLPFPVTVVVS